MGDGGRVRARPLRAGLPRLLGPARAAAGAGVPGPRGPHARARLPARTGPEGARPRRRARHLHRLLLARDGGRGAGPGRGLESAAMAAMSGRTVAITGASSGIGEATAVALAREGAAVALGARRRERLEGLAERIESDGGRALAL